MGNLPSSSSRNPRSTTSRNSSIQDLAQNSPQISTNVESLNYIHDKVRKSLRKPVKLSPVYGNPKTKFNSCQIPSSERRKEFNVNNDIRHPENENNSNDAVIKAKRLNFIKTLTASEWVSENDVVECCICLDEFEEGLILSFLYFNFRMFVYSFKLACFDSHKYFSPSSNYLRLVHINFYKSF